MRSFTSCSISALIFAAAFAVPLSAQEGTPKFLEEFELQFEASARKFVALAEAMPESAYDWRPGEGVSSVAEVYMHVANYNHMYPHENLGLTGPVPESEYSRWEDDISGKAEVLEILTASMQYVRDVTEGMKSGPVDGPTRLYGRTVGEWAVLFQLITHMNEHLGQSIAYARMNGVVPPWSR